MQEKYLVTPALPYANGPIHLGHMVEHIQVNIFVRALRMAHKDVLYVCGADSHGTPIEMNARKNNMSPEKFAQEWQKKQDQTFQDFEIFFDGGYQSTHTPLNETHAHKIYAALQAQGLINQKEIEQLYDPELKRFLPDRLVKGTCPNCKSKDQYGDSCEVCGRTYHPTDLIEPKSALSGATPVLKKSEHYFVSLNYFEEQLKTWTSNKNIIQEDTQAYLKHWFEEGLRDWDISRDGPYFGFLIPGETNKYFYVWLDAPIGYISLSDYAAQQKGRTFADYWLDPNTKIIHFIGKDITYFHTLFWPALLMAARYTLPSQIVVHGMLTVDGEKMSKSRGTFIMADTFKKYLEPETLRYYYASKLSHRAEDLDLNLSDFVQRVNTDLVNKIVNILSRALPLLHRFFEGKASVLDPEAQDLVAKAKKVVELVEKYYLSYEYSNAMNEICRLAEDANKYLQDQAPWKLANSDPERAHSVLTTGVYLGKICFALLKPVLPKAVAKLEDIINNTQEFAFNNIAQEFAPGQLFKTYEHLFKRIEESSVKAMQEASVNKEQKEQVEENNKIIDIKQFADIDLRAARVIKAESVEGSDKLISCTLDVGVLGMRHVFSGLRPHVEPHHLEGKMVVMVANLAPRTMRFGVSEGMILAAGEEKPCVLTVEGASPGARVR
jgi:methionyl-tRNA synthetase